MRILAYSRLSRDRDESLSLDTQEAKIRQWADLHGHDVTAWVRDTDVSGDTAPADRPELGPWLSDRLPEWDILVSYKLDRLSRRLSHFSALIDWATEHGKSVAVISNQLDTTTPAGLLVAQVLATFAQFERSTIQGRILDAKAQRRVSGRWNGGNLPYPYRPVPNPAGGTALELDPESLPVLTEIVTKILGGDSALSIARDLTRRGVPTPKDRQDILHGRKPKGREWSSQAILHMLRGRSILGELVHNHEVVRGDDGFAVRLAEPAIDPVTWARIQKAVAPGPARRTASASGVLDVMYCGLCGSKMYSKAARTRRSGPRPPAYLRCANVTRFKSCPAKHVRYADAFQELESVLLSAYGDMHMMRREYDPGEDHTTAIEESTAALIYLTSQAAGKSAAVRAVYEPRISALEAEIEALSELPNRAPGYRYVPTGQTLAEAWKAAGDAERRALLMRAGVRASVQQTDDGLVLDLYVDPRIFEMVGSA